MVGLPDETPETHEDTVRLNQAINPDVASIFVFYPYPGTEAYDYCLSKGYMRPGEALPENYVSRRQSVLNLPGFSKTEISKCFHWFGFKVFWKHSLIKAIGYKVIYSDYGEFALNLTKEFRKLFRRMLTGF